MSTIKLILGCMFSGKTTALINEYRKWMSINKNVMCVNSIYDDRYSKDSTLFSHDDVNIKCLKVKYLDDVNDDVIKKYDVILINEGQFFDDLVSKCVYWCEKMNKYIVVFGLDGTFQRKPFGHILDLIPYVDAGNIIKLSAYCSICKDGTPASFSVRTTAEKNDIVIGHSDRYIAVCRKHYIEYCNSK